jgi:signal transduction histidine kinase
MTIRKTLLGAFLLVALVPANLLAGFAFFRARQALEDEVGRSLTSQAKTIAADVDKVLFERLQNAAIWSRLEVMQDLQVRDVDRRLSAFLAKVQQGYGGVYRSLDAADRNGRIVASSDPAALGRSVADPPVWQRATLSGAPVALSLPQIDPGSAAATLLIRCPVPSQFGEGLLGELRLRFNWDQIHALLDQAAVDGRMVAVIDAQGRMVAASRSLRTGGHLLGSALAAWNLSADVPGVHILSGAPLGVPTVAVGAASAAHFAGFDGLGWRTVVIQPLDLALAPIHRMVALALVLVTVLLVATVLMAFWVSGAIARPIVALTGFTRRYRGERRLEEVPVAAGGEVGELADAFVGMMKDIDQSQRKLVQTSKLAAVGEMSSLIAHEVRTPLGILRSSAQMLRRETGLSDEARELMGFIESETERLNRLVSTMLDSARPRAPRFSAIDLHALIGRSVGLLAVQATRKAVNFSQALEAADPMIEADAEQLTQVFLNLVLNAVQIVPQGGAVHISTADFGDAIDIRVADDGPGIAPEEREQVFEAFFSRREGGVGLGLAVVQQIILTHGGGIVAGESPLGGACFNIRLPRRQPGNRE